MCSGSGLNGAVLGRGVKYLTHFTRVDNLKYIVEHGLISRDLVGARNINATCNDAHRYDGETGAICCSIGFPNYKMFYKLRCENAGVEWVVLAIKRRVLWQKKCAFCIENAASSSVTSIPIDARMSVDAFNMMYAEVEGKPSRAMMHIREDWPTNPQAEVLVFDQIEVSEVFAILCQNSGIVEKLTPLHPEFKFVRNSEIFLGRNDWQHWK